MDIKDIQADIEALEPNHTPIHTKQSKPRYKKLSKAEKQRRRLVSTEKRRRKHLLERKRNDTMLEVWASKRTHTHI